MSDKVLTTQTIDELKAMSPEELLTFVQSLKGRQAFAETCVHEAAHAVVATLLDVPFDYVTVVPRLTDYDESYWDGNVMAGHIAWKSILGITRYEAEPYAIAAIAPQVALSFFQIERTQEEATEEFSGDEIILDILLRFRPDLTRADLLTRAKEIMTPAVRLWIYRVATKLQEGETLTPQEVRALRAES